MSLSLPTSVVNLARTQQSLQSDFRLHEVELTRVDHGGYKIDVDIPSRLQQIRAGLVILRDASANLRGTTPKPGAIVPLTSDDRKLRGADLKHTDEGMRHVHTYMGVEQLRKLLSLFRVNHLWGRIVHVRVVLLDAADMVIGQSTVGALRTPLQPLPTPLDPATVVTHQPRLTYPVGYGKTMTNKKGEHGHQLVPEGSGVTVYALDGFHYFLRGRQFETRPYFRGFVCITFVGNVLGIPVGTRIENAPVRSGARTSESVYHHTENMAAYLITRNEAQECDFRKKSSSDLAGFFANNMSGRFMIWHDKHVVLLQEGVIYEFTIRSSLFVSDDEDLESYLRRTDAERGGFQTPAADWAAKQVTADKRRKTKYQYSIVKILSGG